MSETNDTSFIDSYILPPLYKIVYYLSWKNAFIESTSTNSWKIGAFSIVFSIILLSINYGVYGILINTYNTTDNNVSNNNDNINNIDIPYTNYSPETQSNYIIDQIKQYITDTSNIIKYSGGKIESPVMPTIDISLNTPTIDISLNTPTIDISLNMPTIDISLLQYKKEELNNSNIYYESMVKMVTINIMGFIFIFICLIIPISFLNRGKNINKIKYYFYDAPSTE
jgi:hypothetical protein